MKEEIKRALKYGNLRYKMICLFLDKIGYSNHTLHKLEVRNKVYRYVKKKYRYVVLNFSHDGKKINNNSDVWICWLQGIENAPDIVRKCVESIEYWLNDKQIHFIDKSNLFDYIDLPNYIIEKWNNGVISNTLFSDFIRLSLLKKYGGLWIDSTVFLTGRLPDYIDNHNFFMYRTPIEDEAKIGESWLLKSPANDELICLTLDIMLEYWKKEYKIRDYFLMFICMKIASVKVGSFRNKVLEVPNRLPEILECYLNYEYSPILWDEICSLTTVHKLNYKRLEYKDNTFLKKILEIQYISGKEKQSGIIEE